MTRNDFVIDVDRLVRRFGRTDAVNGLSLRVRRGRCYGFFGRNGAGKTTTIKCLLNLLRPSAGAVRVFRLDPRRHEVAEVAPRLRARSTFRGLPDPLEPDDRGDRGALDHRGLDRACEPSRDRTALLARLGRRSGRSSSR